MSLADPHTDYLRPYTPPPADRYCACGTRLSRYNDGELCAVCERNAAIAEALAEREEREANGQLELPKPPRGGPQPCSECGVMTQTHRDRRNGLCWKCFNRRRRCRVCVSCGELRGHKAVGLCPRCYRVAVKRGTLQVWQLVEASNTVGGMPTVSPEAEAA